MKKLLAYSDLFLQQSTWKTLSIMKICLLSLGLIVGCNVPKEHKKTAKTIAGILFVVTYIPLMARLFGTILNGNRGKQEIQEKKLENDAC